ncbi:MAG: DUF47 family protein [Ignavibacteriae bacterium]|nr:DUF47 family protein [Ignavibacteriota bacterium]
MFRGILPKHYEFFDFFDEHIALTITVCNELLDATSKDANLAQKANTIKELEHRLDDITHRCTDALHRTFITPIERTDIHALIKRLDDVADNINNAVSRMVLYEVVEVRYEAKQIASVLCQAAIKIQAALMLLRSLKEPEKISVICREIRGLEDEGDALLSAALIRLFKEGEPMLVIMWKEIFERLEKAIDRCKDIANLIEGVVIDAA